MKRVLVWTGVAALAVAGCSKDNKTKETQAPATAPTATPGAAPTATPGAMPATGAHGAAPAAAGSGAGKVLETMDSGGYTYVKVDVGGQPVWAAGPQTTVKVGDQVSFSGGAPMANYHSKTLDRTFELVYFVPAIQLGGEAAAAAPPAGHGGAAPAGHGGAPAPAAQVEAGDVKKAKGGKTIAEVFAGKGDLAGKQVVVRGKVVKYNGGIMGRNWLHLQDGSGAAGTNDLTVTSDATAAVGDTVVVEGTVATNKDFGAGYKYDVIVENAKVTVE